MIARLPKGRVGFYDGSSKGILIDYSLPSAKGGAGSMNFEGGLGLSAERRESLPVILFPAMREFGLALQLATDAIYQLQQASLQFRVVAVSDMPLFKSFRSFGWANSHLHDEGAWADPTKSWKSYVCEEMDQIAKDFGCSYAVSLSDRGISNASWVELLSLAGVSPTVGNPTSRVDSTNVHYSWRGWMDSLPVGSSSHVVKSEECEWSVRIDKEHHSSMVFIGSPTSENEYLARLARARGWNCVTMSSNSPMLSRQNEKLAVAALLDGLSLAGAGIISAQLPSEFGSGGYCATAFIDEPSDGDLELAERKALAFWSSRVS